MTAPKAPAPKNDWNLQDVLLVALAYWRLIALVTAVFVVFGFAYCRRATPLYQATTTVRIPETNSASAASEMMNYSMGGEGIESDIEICQSENVAFRVIKEMGLDQMPGFKGATPKSMCKGVLGMISVSNILKSDVLSIRAETTNPGFAADLANAWAKCFIEAELDLAHEAASARGDFLQAQAEKMREKLASPELRLSDESKSDQVIYDQLLSNLREARLAESNQTMGVVVVDKALPSDGPVKPQKKKIMEMFFFLGLFVGFQFSLLLDWLGDRLRALDKLKRVSGLPNYGVIPDFNREFPNSPSSGNLKGVKSLILNPAFANSDYMEGFRVLRTSLNYAQTGKPVETVAVLSPSRGEGTSLINANLALSLAQVGKKVLLVDADLRQPGVADLFGAEPKSGMGLPAVLAGLGPWKSMVMASGAENLDLLPNRTIVPNATELLSGEPMKRFIEETKKAYDIVVFDGAPVLQLTDSLILAALLDGVMLLARWGKTRSSDVAKAVEELASVKAQAVGTILNGTKDGSNQEFNIHHFLKQGSGWQKWASFFEQRLKFFKWFLP
jgi:capsular exopolysaccharide synthesis family protein